MRRNYLRVRQSSAVLSVYYVSLCIVSIKNLCMKNLLSSTSAFSAISNRSTKLILSYSSLFCTLHLSNKHRYRITKKRWQLNLRVLSLSFSKMRLLEIFRLVEILCRLTFELQIDEREKRKWKQSERTAGHVTCQRSPRNSRHLV